MSTVGDIRVNAYMADGFMSPQSQYAPVLRGLGSDGAGRVLVAVEPPRPDGTPPGPDGTPPGRRAPDGGRAPDGSRAVDPAAQIVGTVMLQTWPTTSEFITAPGEAEIRALAVVPGAQGRGVGGKLLQAVIETATHAGVRHLLLLTQPEMRAAHHLYQRAGFVRLPERDRSPVPGVNLLAFGLCLD